MQLATSQYNDEQVQQYPHTPGSMWTDPFQAGEQKNSGLVDAGLYANLTEASLRPRSTCPVAAMLTDDHDTVDDTLQSSNGGGDGGHVIGTSGISCASSLWDRGGDCVKERRWGEPTGGVEHQQAMCGAPSSLQTRRHVKSPHLHISIEPQADHRSAPPNLHNTPTDIDTHIDEAATGCTAASAKTPATVRADLSTQLDCNGEKITRPLNCFMLFGQHRRAEFKAEREAIGKGGETAEMNNTLLRDQALQSKIIGSEWAELSELEKEEWRQKAQAAKLHHASMYPNYKYKPGAPKVKVKRTSSRSAAEHDFDQKGGTGGRICGPVGSPGTRRRSSTRTNKSRECEIRSPPTPAMFSEDSGRPHYYISPPMMSTAFCGTTDKSFALVELPDLNLLMGTSSSLSSSSSSAEHREGAVIDSSVGRQLTPATATVNSLLQQWDLDGPREKPRSRPKRTDLLVDFPQCYTNSVNDGEADDREPSYHLSCDMLHGTVFSSIDDGT
jgi:hypothetical protein